MKKILLLLFLASNYSFACLNGETKELKNGVFVYEDHQGSCPYGHDFYIDNFPKLINDLDSLYIATKDLDYLSDKGYVLIIQGKYLEAIDVYEKIEKLEPNRYSTASNVGTIYELIGENKKAYDWIKKAIRINTKSHNESEWLHLKILEAKINGESYITSDFLLNLNFGNNPVPNSKLTKKERDNLIKALYYQLNERISFIKSNDKIISLLLFELGNLLSLNKDYYSAECVYNKAIEYGFCGKLLSQRLDYLSKSLFIKQIDEEHKIKNKYEFIQNENNILKVIVTVSTILLLVLLIIIYKLRKKNKLLKNESRT